MGEIKIKIPDELENVFRELAMRRFGYQKGSMSQAANEAFEGWTSLYNEPEEQNEDPIEAIAGLMKHLKKSSVDLQHEAWRNVGKEKC